MRLEFTRAIKNKCLITTLISRFSWSIRTLLRKSRVFCSICGYLSQFTVNPDWNRNSRTSLLSTLLSRICGTWYSCWTWWGNIWLGNVQNRPKSWRNYDLIILLINGMWFYLDYVISVFNIQNSCIEISKCDFRKCIFPVAVMKEWEALPNYRLSLLYSAIMPKSAKISSVELATDWHWTGLRSDARKESRSTQYYPFRFWPYFHPRCF